MDKVLVKIISRQKSVAGEKDCIDLTAIGKHYYKNGMHYVLYEEAMEGETSVHTMLKISDTTVTLVRRGAINQQQCFVLNESSESTYMTAYGNLRLAVYPHKLTINYGTVAGDVAIDYDLSLNGQLQSHNKLRIEISAEPAEIG